MIVYEIYLCYLLDISKKVLENYDFVIVLRRNLQKLGAKGKKITMISLPKLCDL